ncbi:glucose 1-dehydrogenase [Psychrobacter celer]|uniref:Glucose 1-dehydrogenase n=1 Tax=Psychrobacter halodurans TaxID=2818439 RepID=A0AAW4IQN5_9GAMM|nr:MULTISPECIES: glucose 1-dehydrogenase [Psychrobacter]MBO1517570.1 glucose 1-dehydrogenase [Psychrobacter halodurans]MDN5734086.1 glucose 1-dehydrogenase [Psychrobacter sp.]OLF40026.1 3-alpha-hydroxysteroid dehydrogenase [Psychrobacter sp. Rd 27.2]PJX24181.1 3-alpha-hydroxysteroid dehydrogenase [Psychrobacter sp. L7]
MARLQDKVIIITGAAQGMGETHARLCLAEGAKVVLTDINAEKGEALAKELGDNALFVKHDVTDEEDWSKVANATQEKFGQIDVLVNNAGITTHKSILDTSVADYRKILEINQVSVFLGMKAVIPVMQAAKQGSIINISSINGLVGGAIGYTDSKFAVRGMTKAAALECAPHGIRVNSIHPGVIATPMIMQGDTKDAVEAFAKTIPMRRVAQPEEVSNMVLFLASDDSSYSTGAEFVIDGGLTAQ